MKTQRFIALAIMAGGLTLAAASADAQVKVSVGYADTLRSPAFTPTPWLGTAGVIFIGSSAPWDAGAILLDNPSANALRSTTSRSISAPRSVRSTLGSLPDRYSGEGQRCANPDDAVQFRHLGHEHRHLLCAELLQARRPCDRRRQHHGL